MFFIDKNTCLLFEQIIRTADFVCEPILKIKGLENLCLHFKQLTGAPVSAMVKQSNMGVQVMSDGLRIGTLLQSKLSIRFINPETKRPIIFKSSDKLWITGRARVDDNTVYKIGRCNKHHLNEGYYFPLNVVTDMFEVEDY